MVQFRKIALALAFSPRTQALLAEAARLKNLWNAELILIHVGEYGEREKLLLNEFLASVNLSLGNDVRVCWEQGNPSERILATCKKESVELLVAGALKQENIMQYYLGTIARRILRKADCSVLMLTDPSNTPAPFRNIVVNTDDSAYIEDAVRIACTIGMKDKASWLHVVREIKLYGLTMSASDQHSETEYEHLRQTLVKDEIDIVEKLLKDIPHEGLKINIKMLAGKSGFELAKFAQRKRADLLVVGAAPRRFSLFDRVFPHGLEYIFADMPCNLLVVNPVKSQRIGKEVKHG